MKWFCQDISVLVGTRNMHQLQKTILDLIPNRMTVYLHVLGSLMEDRVSSNVNGRFVITKELGIGMYLDLQICQDLLQPKQLTSSMSHTPIFSLNAAATNNILFLGLPSD